MRGVRGIAVNAYVCLSVSYSSMTSHRKPVVSLYNVFSNLSSEENKHRKFDKVWIVLGYLYSHTRDNRQTDTDRHTNRHTDTLIVILRTAAPLPAVK